MSRYEELCRSFHQNVEHFQDYREENLKFATELVEQFVSYFGINCCELLGSLRFLPTGSQNIDDRFSLPESLKFGRDKHWQFSLLMTVTEPSYTHWDHILISFRFRKTDGRFHVFLGKERFVIRPDDDKALQPMFEAIFKKLKARYDYFEEAISSPMIEPAERSPIGFRI